MRRISSRGQALFSLVVMALAGTLLVACGGGGSKTKAAANPTTTAPGGGQNSAFAAYRTCMKNHGVDLPQRQRGQNAGPNGTQGPNGTGGPPDGGGGGGGGFFGQNAQPPPGVDANTFNQARQACQALLPNPNDPAFQQQRQQRQQFNQCMRDHGVNVPDFGGRGGPGGTDQTTPSTGPRPTIDRNDPKYQAARQACQSLLPNRGQGGGGPGGGGSGGGGPPTSA